MCGKPMSMRIKQDIYIPFFQAPNQYAPLVIRTDQPASFWLPAVRAAIAAIDPEVAIYESPSLQQEANRLVAGTRFLTSMLTGFAIFAALLAVLGIYGVTVYAVQQREREMAIRVALGATRSTVVRMFLGDGALVLVSGIACGLLAAAALTRVLEHQLYGVQRSDPSTLFATGALMMAAGLLATWWPARRAAITDPLPLLKEE